jgi:carboxylesterase type B
LLAKKVNGVRMLVGNNADEGALFVPPVLSTQDDLSNWLQHEFPSFTSAQIAQILAAYPSTSSPVNPADPRYATNGYGPGTAINISEAATGQQQRANNIYAEATFICPSYWLASAFIRAGHGSYHYQYSVPFAMHQADVSAYFGPATPNQGPDFQLAFRRIWGNFIMTNNPSISNAVANGAASVNPAAANPASTWPLWNDQKPQQINLNETGGVPYTYMTTFGASVTQFMDPGLKNNITLVDASAWEGGRGQRCQFWRTMSPSVPQ